MRLAFAAIALVHFAKPIEAQTYYCSRPSEPNIPSPYSADYNRMERAQRDVEEYFDDMRDYIDCIQSEIDDAIREAEMVGNDWDSTVRRFNSQ